jgi:hypothetical protein
MVKNGFKNITWHKPLTLKYGNVQKHDEYSTTRITSGYFCILKFMLSYIFKNHYITLLQMNFF